MKKILSLMLAMIFMFSVPVQASSYASLNKVKTVRDGEIISDQYLKITPRDEVTTGSSIIITFTNAEVPDQSQIDVMYQYSYRDWKGASQGFWDVMPNVKTNELPYKIRKTGKNEIQVTLINLPARYVSSLYRVNGSTKHPVYNIRLPLISDGSGTIQIKIDSNESTISSATLSGNYIWTKGSGATATTVGLSDTEGDDGEIIESTTVETTTETTTQAVAENSDSEEEDEEEEVDIFKLDADDLIAVRYISDIISDDDLLSYVDWDSDTKTVTISYKGNVLQFISGSDYYILNDEMIWFESDDEETEPVIANIINRRMYVPVGIVIDALGLKPEGAEETAEAEEAEETTEIIEEITEA